MKAKSLITLLLAAALAACGEAPEAPAEFDLYLVRHAEKRLDQGADPELTAPGRERAGRLAEWLAPRGIESLWSSDYRRTRATLAPLAERLDLPVRIYDVQRPEALALTLLAEGRTAVVAGHSDTVPELAARLCECGVPAMEETEYERLLLVRVRGGERSLMTLDQRDLPASP